MPIVNGNYYMNGNYGQSLEQAKIADVFPGLAEQTGSQLSGHDQRAGGCTSTIAITRREDCIALEGRSLPPTGSLSGRFSSDQSRFIPISMRTRLNESPLFICEQILR